MTLPVCPTFDSAIAELAVPGVTVGYRLISPGDEDALLPAEAAAIEGSIESVRRASGAARIVARQLLSQVGYSDCAVPRGRCGAPIWPAGIMGSLAHDAEYAVAAVGQRRDVDALGIDVEPAELLPRELVDLVATPKERTNLAADPFGGRTLFVAKEAVYKAVYPLDQTFLDYHDIEIDLVKRKAIICNGRVVDLRFGASAHLVGLAFIPSAGPAAVYIGSPSTE